MDNRAKRLKDLSKVIENRYTLIDLRKFYNNDAFSYDDLKCDGDFDSNGGTFPAEELPNSNSIIRVDNIPFFFPSKEKSFVNNMVLDGQTICFTPKKYRSVYFLGATEGFSGEAYEEEITVSFSDGSYKSIYLGLSNWLLSSKFNEKIAFLCSHLHYPDRGQKTIYNTLPNDIDDYSDDNATYYSLTNYDYSEDAKNAKNGVWLPRIWMQNIELDIDSSILAITFKENINFHIFAITFEE